MQYRLLGSTDLRISALAFGAGPVPALMTGADESLQVETIERAIDVGINWFDTAATYGDGRSESSLGRFLDRADRSAELNIATKVRLLPEHLDSIGRYVKESVLGSLQRLRIGRLALVQVHNSITAQRGQMPTSLAPADVLGPLADALEQLRAEGLARCIGLTGIGQPDALRQVIRSGRFQTIQVPFHLLDPADLENIIADCAAQKMGVFAIRVFAGGALAGNAPSDHTRKTPFFPLALYERDRQRAGQLQQLLGPQIDLKEIAIRFAAHHPSVHSAIVGFGHPDHVNQAAAALDKGPLPPDILTILRTFTST